MGHNMSNGYDEHSSAVSVVPPMPISRFNITVQLGRNWTIFIPLSRFLAMLLGGGSMVAISVGYLGSGATAHCGNLQYHYPTADKYPKADSLFAELDDFVDRYSNCDANFLHDARRKMRELHNSTVKDLQDAASKIATLTTVAQEAKLQITRQGSEIEALTGAAGVKESRIARLEAQITAMTEVLRNKDLEAAARIAAFEQQRSEEVKALRKAIDELGAAMQSAIDQKIAEIAAWRKELDDRTSDHTKLQRRLDVTEAQLAAMREQLCVLIFCVRVPQAP